MPELPEVEHLRRTLRPHLVGCRITRVRLARSDIVEHDGGASLRGRESRLLLRGATVRRLVRHGKQLALVTDGPVVCVHLGMSGQLRRLPPGRPIPDPAHVHCLWQLARDGARAGRLIFRDPRRFGGLWTFRSLADLRRGRWSDLGPDALRLAPERLLGPLGHTRRAIKAALLDQSVVAGLGNIYVDEALFAAGIDPRSTSRAVPARLVRKLGNGIPGMLRRAIAAGGTTLRDYVDGDGRSGDNRTVLQAYGRAGLACHRCGGVLEGLRLAQRATVVCSQCQRLFQE